MDPRSTVLMHTGRRMPILGLGTWQLTRQTAYTIEEAIRIGYRMIDTSGDYGTQPGVGEGIRRSGTDRKGIFVVTKVEETDDAYASTRKNLKELGLDYADLVLIHRPPRRGVGEELWRQLLRAQDEKFAIDIGVSNYSENQISDLFEKTDVLPVVNQIEWSPFGHSRAMFDYAEERNIVIQAYSPLTRGSRLKDPTLLAIAEKYRKSPAQILIRWNLERCTIPIPKANKEKHLRENIDVFNFELTREDVHMLNGLNEHYSALGSLPYH